MRLGVLISGRGIEFAGADRGLRQSRLPGRNRARHQQSGGCCRSGEGGGGPHSRGGRPASQLAASLPRQPMRNCAQRRRRARLPRRLHAAARHGFCRGVARPDGQHPSLAAARLPRPPRSAPGAGGGRALCRLHSAFRAPRDRTPARSSPRRSCRCIPRMTTRRLSARILAAEHRLYPLAVRLIAEGRTRIIGGKVEIDGWQASDLAGAEPVGPAARPTCLAPRLGCT